MDYTSNEKRSSSTAIWILAMLCMVAVIFSVCAGAAYTGIRQARLSAARANIGQIEAVLYLAEKYAEENGLGAAPKSYDNMLMSYDEAGSTALTPYEKFVLEAMLDSLGTNRDFDFAITRYQDGSVTQTQIYYFPVRGASDVRRDHYYLLSGNTVVEKNA